MTALADAPATTRGPLLAARPGRGRLVAPLTALAVAAGAAAVVGWWWVNTPTVHGLGDWLTNAGRITGLLAGYLLAWLLILMARTPLLEHHVGADVLARWHARAGRYTVGLVVAHGLLVTWGYAVLAHTGVVRQASTLLLSYPDVLMATVGGLLLVGVGVVSARAARARMRYETWYYQHLYTYLAIALSFAHVFATGQEFASHPFARVLWSALYLFAAGAVVWYRIATPAYRTWRHRMRVGRVVAEGPGVVSIVLRGRHVDELGVQPGQFVRLRFLSRDLWWAAHPFSLSAAPHGDLLRVTVKHLGDHTGHMPALRHGTRVLVEGPYGALTAQRRTRRKVLLLAGGIGITPLRALFQSLPAAPGDLTLVYRAERPDDLVLRREIETLAERREQAAHFLPGRVGGDRDVLVGDRLRRLLPDLRAHDVYVCGPPGFVNAATAALRRLGVSRRHIHSENFAF
jgi:predicted ferric reductase